MTRTTHESQIEVLYLGENKLDEIALEKNLLSADLTMDVAVAGQLHSLAMTLTPDQLQAVGTKMLEVAGELKGRPNALVQWGLQPAPTPCIPATERIRYRTNRPLKGANGEEHY